MARATVVLALLNIVFLCHTSAFITNRVENLKIGESIRIGSGCIVGFHGDKVGSITLTVSPGETALAVGDCDSVDIVGLYRMDDMLLAEDGRCVRVSVSHENVLVLGDCGKGDGAMWRPVGGGRWANELGKCLHVSTSRVLLQANCALSTAGIEIS